MKLHRIDFLCELLLVTVAILHVLICPFTKVEESFNLHAIHDIQTRGISDSAVSKYDHKTFTGPLPRSFVGAITVATASYPSILLAEVLHIRGPLVRQMLIRITLALSNSACLIFLARRLRDVFHSRVSRQFLILTSCQFHIPFWLGRTVPNMLAFGPAQIALACILLPKQRTTRRWSRPDVLLGLSILTILSVILRLELVGLLVPLAVQAWLYDRVDWLEGGFTILASGLAALSITLSVDSHFWQDSVWPELNNLLFNVIQGKSADWGVSPWYTYPFVSLPKLMLLAYPLFLAGILANPIARRLSVPLAAYVGIMGLLKHKEWRFISYIVPTFNIISLASIVRIRRYNRRLSKYIFRVVCFSSLAVTLLSIILSTYNYPGGNALLSLNALLQAESRSASNTIVHLDSYSCMTGASNLLHQSILAKYDKDETLTSAKQYSARYDYLVTHEPDFHNSKFEVVRGIRGWAGLSIQLGEWRSLLRTRDLRFLHRKKEETLTDYVLRTAPLRPRIEEQVYIMRKKS